MLWRSALLTVALLCPQPRAQAALPTTDRPDLHAHFWLSFGLSLLLTEILEGPDPQWGPQLGTGWATLIATGAVGLLGLTKELIDPRFDSSDLLADLGGLGLNVLVQWTIDF